MELVSFARSLNKEEQHGVSENLSEEELTILDLLICPNIKLTKKEHEQIKQVANESKRLLAIFFWKDAVLSMTPLSFIIQASEGARNERLPP